MENSNENKNSNEEIIIENTYTVTEELEKKWSKENKTVIYFRIFWILITICCIGLTIYCINSNNMEHGDVLVVFACFGIWRVIFSYYRTCIEHDRLVEMFKKSNLERKTIFFDDYFEVIVENKVSFKIQYSEILNIEKNSECIKLKTNFGYVRIYKNAFVKSNFEECEEFLNKKMKDSNSEK